MPTLTKRKLIAMGDGGLVITVPKAWRDYYGLKAGDVVVVVANGDLRISPPMQEKDSSGGHMPDIDSTKL
jgi:bifunctional DNA-binding transcriptional regulator/antitoxin component of YhaV-PrlF toxin-antitoxin module